MKKMVIVFVVGILIGAIIATGGVCVYAAVRNSNLGKDKSTSSQKGEMPSMNDNNFGQPPQMQGGQSGNNSAMPEMPDGNNGNFSRGGQNSNSNQFPQMPGGNSNSSGGSNSSGNQQAPELPSGQ